MKNLELIAIEEERRRAAVVELLMRMFADGSGYTEGDEEYEWQKNYYSEQSTDYLEKAHDRNTDRKVISDEAFVDFMIKFKRWDEDDRQRLIDNFTTYEEFGWQGLLNSY